MKPDRAFFLSLPERVLRSVAALTAGLVREIGNVSLPSAIRQTMMYRVMVDTTLRFLIEQVGEVEGEYPSEGKLAQNFLAQRVVGDGIDFAGLVAFHASPVWVFAALADLSGAGRHLIDEISTSLKERGLLEPETRFETVDQVLDGLERSAGKVASAIRVPPLDVASLRKEWSDLKEAVASIPPRSLPSVSLLSGQWETFKRTAAEQDRSVFELSTLVALATIRSTPENLLWLSKVAGAATLRTGQFFGQGLLDHYRDTLNDIRQTGFFEYWRREFRPYLHAAAKQFSTEHQSLTERLLRRSDIKKDAAP